MSLFFQFVNGSFVAQPTEFNGHKVKLWLLLLILLFMIHCRCTSQLLMIIGASSSTTMTIGSSMAVRNWRKPQRKMSTQDFFIFYVVIVVSDVFTSVFDVNVAGRQDCRLLCCHTVLMMLMFHLLIRVMYAGQKKCLRQTKGWTINQNQ